MNVNCTNGHCGTAAHYGPLGAPRGGPRPAEQPRPGTGREVARQTTFAATASAALEVTTADGDTVSISFETARRFAASRGPEGRSLTAEASIDVQVEVTGSLSDAEVEDISNLLQDLVQTGARPAPEAPTSVASYAFAYQSTTEASFTRIGRVYA